MTKEEIFKKWGASEGNVNGFTDEPIEGVDYLSYSRVSTFLKSAEHYRAKYIDKEESPESAAFAEGKVIHKALLEMDDFLARMRVKPHRSSFGIVTKEDLLSHARDCGITTVLPSWAKPKVIAELRNQDADLSDSYDVALEEFESSLDENSMVFDEPTANRVIRIIKSVSAHPFARKLIDGGIPETIAYYHDKEFNVTWMARLDYVKFFDGKAYITDLKSTRDASEKQYQRDMANYGYFIQSWIYRRVVEGITGMETRFCQAVVEKDSPFRTKVFYVDPQAEETAYWCIGRAIDRMKTCMATNKWWDPDSTGLIQASMPNWAVWDYEAKAERELDATGGNSQST